MKSRFSFPDIYITFEVTKSKFILKNTNLKCQAQKFFAVAIS